MQMKLYTANTPVFGAILNSRHWGKRNQKILMHTQILVEEVKTRKSKQIIEEPNHTYLEVTLPIYS